MKEPVDRSIYRDYRPLNRSSSEDRSRIFILGRVDIFKLGLKKGSMVENDLSLLPSRVERYE